MIKLFGYEEKKGSFVNKDTGEQVAYHNYVLHFGTDEKEGIHGMFCDNVTAKADNFVIKGAKDLDAAIGHEVDFAFDVTAKTDENGKVRQLVKKLLVY